MDITVEDGTFRAFVAKAAGARPPVILVLHEIFGVNDDIRATCHEFAERGFTAVAPDLFWREAPGLDLNSWSEADWKRGLELYSAYDLDRGIRDIAAVLTVARATAPGLGVGVTGFCLGGLMAFLTLARTDADAGVAYYPGAIDQHLSEAAKVTAPLMIHLGTEDEYISPTAQGQVKDAFAGRPNVQIFNYDGMSHAFARHTGTHFDVNAAALANCRTFSFFGEMLGVKVPLETSAGTG